MSHDTIAVTGGLGGVGRWLVDRLADDHAVHCLDLASPAGERENVTFHEVDLTDRGEAPALLHELAPDAVVHLATNPRDAGTYLHDVTMVHDVLTTAGRMGADAVWTSSETIYGTHWIDEPWIPEYLPVDEAHPTEPWNPYETAKASGEAVADMVARRYDVRVASVRPSWVQHPGEYALTGSRESFDRSDPDPPTNLWSYVDVRDLAALIEAALSGDFEGHEVFNAFAAENYLGVPTAVALEAAWGRLPEPCHLEGEAGGFSTGKARTLLDWEPAHSWRTAADEAVDGPDF